MRDVARCKPWDLMRNVFQDGLLVPSVRAFCTPFRTSHAASIAAPGPFVVVANHGSHLDTPALLAALPPALRHRTAVAAAEDYFYRRRWLGLACSLGIGTFPFPRHGREGTQRAAQLLAHGWSVALFPQGSRGSGGQLPFRAGVGHLLVQSGAIALPVGIIGTHEAWPRGQKLPCRRAVEVRIGEPWKPDSAMSAREIAEELERRVNALASTIRSS